MTSFQTVRLTRGRHGSPREGTCVAELTSMLAGERYSDHPRCACPALTAFLRGYNDGLDDVLRQDLFALASDLVGTRGPEAVTTRRAEELVALAWRYTRRAGPLRLGPVLNFPRRLDRCEGAGLHLGRCANHQPDCHREVMATLSRLATREVLERVVGRDRLPGGRVVDEGAPRRPHAWVAVERR
jgi:hypothetical protein